MPAQQIQPAKKDTSNGQKSLADVLLANGVLKVQRAEQVKIAEIQTGKSQEDIIKEQNLVSEKDLVQAKAEL